MAENGFFGTAFRGFRKEDVLNYIDNLNTAHCEEVAALTQQAADLKNDNERLAAQLPALQTEVEQLRVRAEQAERFETALAEATEVNAKLSEQLEAANTLASKADAYERELETLREQVSAQQASLDTYKKMFGDSCDAVSFVREHVDARMQESRRRTEQTISEVEQVAARLSAELETLRSRTAAIRNETVLANEKDAAALATWFQQFDKAVPARTESHFFR